MLVLDQLCQGHHERVHDSLAKAHHHGPDTELGNGGACGRDDAADNSKNIAGDKDVAASENITQTAKKNEANSLRGRPADGEPRDERARACRRLLVFEHCQYDN